MISYGSDPGEQLCTDDFAGHLAHNTNLSIKAIMGIEGYSMILGRLGEVEAQNKYHKIAQDMAIDWEKRADAGEHYMLAFGESDTWSLKYNLVWDKLFQSDLFSEKIYEKEFSWYMRKVNQYGVPLDNRADYLENTKSQVPFGDWYDTVTGKYEHFIARSVQGGIYMPIFKKYMEEITTINRNNFQN